MIKEQSEDASKALCWAAKNGQLRAVEFFVKEPVEKWAHDKALYEAAKNGHLHVVQLLIEKVRYTVSACDKALFLAEEHGNLEIAEFLREVIK